MDIATFLVQCLNALQYGLLLFLVASGLTLIFGIMGVINLAHGSFYMIGAYLAYALALALGMYAVISRTRLGMRIRAGASNREMVESLGIDIRQLYRVMFAAGVALAVLAGMLAAPISSVYPGMGNQVLIICFVVVVIGGIGSVRGPLAAARPVGPGAPLGKGFFPHAAGGLGYVLQA